MQQKKLEKDLIFFSPGEKGTVFTFKAGNFYDDHLVDQTINHLQYETENPISWTEERRSAPRPV